ncbi:MAG TPA: alkaline phosphatase family protein, partial [Streptomyces sp.]
QPFTAFPSDFSQLPTVSWVIPNLCDDMHNCSIATGDTWLKSHLDSYVQWAKTHNSLLITTFDEDDSSTSANRIATFVNGQPVKAGAYAEHIDHFSVLRTIEDMYGLPYAGAAAQATSITDAWNTGSTGSVSVTNPGAQSGTVGTSASLQLQATDTAGGTLGWTAAGLPPGLSVNSSTGTVTGTPTTAGTYSVTVTATDSTGPSGTATFNWTVTGGTGGGCTAAQLLGNPGFESGNTAWSSTSGVVGQWASQGEPTHSGTWNAWLNGWGSPHTDTLSQSVTIPAACTSATLTFYLHIDTAETTTSTAYDTLTVQAGATTLATYSNLTHNSGYSLKSLNLSPYIGKTVTLKFTGTEDDSLQTSFVIDDAAVNVS